MFVLRSCGAEGIKYHIREHVRLARELADRITADGRFDVVAPARSLVSFRHVDGDAATRALASGINASGRHAVTPSVLPDGRAFIRVSVGQTRTEQQHVDGLWQLIDTCS